MTNLVMKALIIILAILINGYLLANLLSFILCNLYGFLIFFGVWDYMVVCVCRQN